MTDHTFWDAVAAALRLQREQRGWTVADVERHGGPNYATVQATERGEIGTVTSLMRHASAFGLGITDIFRSVLAVHKLSPEAEWIARTFDAIGDDNARGALAAIARLATPTTVARRHARRS